MKIAILTTDNREHYRDYSNPVPYFGTAPEALLQGFALIRDHEVHVVSCARGRMKSPERLAPNIFFHSLYVPKIGWMRTVYQGCIRAVRHKLKEIRPDIVHGQGTERDCAISAVFSGHPNVLTIHGNLRLIAQVTEAKRFSFLWLAARLEALTIPRSGGVVCITGYTQNAVSDLAKRTWIVPNAVDSKFFDVQHQLNGSRVVLCVGNVCHRKNQVPFIRALDEWAPKNKIKVIFLGHAPRDYPYVAEFFKLLETRPWCVYEGFADREKLKVYLQTASLLALPSLEDNCPMVVLEAMASGVPVMAAKVGGLPELIEEGLTGYFCDPLSSESMCQALANALSNPAATRKLAAQAKQRALERFHPRVIAQRHLEIYGEVLNLRT
jgi:glycosyltransferase involved in cell wall biosynthesis